MNEVLIIILIMMIAILSAIHVLSARKQINASKAKSEPCHIILPDKDATLKVSLGDTVEYSHSVYSSVGHDYRAEYVESAFDKYYHMAYDSPEEVNAGMNGADSGIKTYTFKTLRKGTYTIVITHDYRGNVEKILTYKIIVT